MSGDHDRLQLELSLLGSMYPEQVHYNEHSREVYYAADTGSFSIRVPPHYPESEPPYVILANVGKKDVREQLKRRITQAFFNEECLDAVIVAFNEMIEEIARSDADNVEKNESANEPNGELSDKKATIVIWLHHLLNADKRKRALSPASAAVSGVTKPGYPGVLVYSGPVEAVHRHVNELKQLNWAAFQVRLETDGAWTFAHGPGVREVEAMKDVVAEVGEPNKCAFLEAMRMK